MISPSLPILISSPHQYLLNNAIMTSYNRNSAFVATLDSPDNCTTRRVIGAKGSGIRRITDAVKNSFPGSRCYIRAQSNDGRDVFTIKAQGSNGANAVRAAAQFLRKEFAWINGNGKCPHAHAYVPQPDDTSLLKHIIGAKGCNIKRIIAAVNNRTESGVGCFIVHKPDLNKFLVEGLSDTQVRDAVRQLRDHIRNIVSAQQAPTTVKIDHTPVTTTSSSTFVTGGAFDALVESSDDEEHLEEHPEEQHNNEMNTASKPTLSRSVSCEPTLPSQTRDSRAINAIFQRTKETLAAELGCEPRSITDRQVNQRIRQLELADKTPTTSTNNSFDISSEEQFPGSSNIKLVVDTSAWNYAPQGVTQQTGATYSLKSTQAAAVQAEQDARRLRQLARRTDELTVDIQDDIQHDSSTSDQLPTHNTSQSSGFVTLKLDNPPNTSTKKLNWADSDSDDDHS